MSTARHANVPTPPRGATLGWWALTTVAIALLGGFAFLYSGTTCAASDGPSGSPRVCVAARESAWVFFLPVVIPAACTLIAAFRRLMPPRRRDADLRL